MVVCNMDFSLLYSVYRDNLKKVNSVVWLYANASPEVVFVLVRSK